MEESLDDLLMRLETLTKLSIPIPQSYFTMISKTDLANMFEDSLTAANNQQPSTSWPFPTPTAPTPQPVPVNNGSNGVTNIGPTTVSSGTTTSLPIPGSGNVTVTSSSGTAIYTSNGTTWQSVPVTSTPNAVYTITGTITAAKGTPKSKLRYVIVKSDQSCLELSEQDVITPQEMINISKFLSIVSCIAGSVSTTAHTGYNTEIVWSELIRNLDIERHFVTGGPRSTYTSPANVLDILLFDPT